MEGLCRRAALAISSTPPSQIANLSTECSRHRVQWTQRPRGSTTGIDSRGNLFRADGVQAGLGWSLMGGGGPPIPLIIGSTSDNLLTIDSTEDRIEASKDFFTASMRRAGVRYFGPPTAGTSDRNRAELYLRGTHITSVLGDVMFVSALAASDRHGCWRRQCPPRATLRRYGQPGPEQLLRKCDGEPARLWKSRRNPRQSGLFVEPRDQSPASDRNVQWSELVH
jgi:hypothetical protein